MSSASEDEEELTPSQQVAELLAALQSDSSSGDVLQCWELQQDRVTELYRCQLQPAGRAELAALDYEANWAPLLRLVLAALPAVAEAALSAASPTAASRALSLTRMLVILRNLCPAAGFQRRLRSDMLGLLCADSAELDLCGDLVRLVERGIAQESPAKEPRLLLKSLLQLWANMLTPTGSAAAGDLSDLPWLWVHSALFPGVLGLILRLHRGMPEIASIAIAIVHHALLCNDAQASAYDRDVNPLTRKCISMLLSSPSSSPFSSANTSTTAPILENDPFPQTRVSSCMLLPLLDASVGMVERELEAVYASEADSAEKAPLSLWDWRPHNPREPSWIVEVLGMVFRTHVAALPELAPILSNQQLYLILRMIEVSLENMQQNQERMEEEIKRMNINAEKKKSNDVDAVPSSSSSAATSATSVAMEVETEDASAASSADEPSRPLRHTAEAVASNAVFLLQWLQQRPLEPLPAVSAPTVAPPAATSSVASDASASASSSSSAAPAVSASTSADAAANVDATSAAAAASAIPSSSLPLDAASNSILATLGHVLLFESWSTGVVFSGTRAALSLQGVVGTLLGLLQAADVKDGGSMFSDLYRKPSPASAAATAGHTRHTKPSDDPQAYVNQFKTTVASGEEAASSSSSSSTATPASASAATSSTPAARQTPYLFKSNLLRLFASLSFRSPTLQSSFGGAGVYACMNHSVLDDHNPLMREYAILALRNLLEDHPANQQIVAELRTDAIANQQHMKDLGVDAELDPDTGKIRIASNRQPPPKKVQEE